MCNPLSFRTIPELSVFGPFCSPGRVSGAASTCCLSPPTPGLATQSSGLCSCSFPPGWPLRCRSHCALRCPGPGPWGGASLYLLHCRLFLAGPPAP